MLDEEEPKETRDGETPRSYFVVKTEFDIDDAQNIRANSYANFGKMAELYLPITETIEDNAFMSCIGLQTLSIPNVTSIGNSSFYNCLALTSANLPLVTSIGDLAFAECNSLSSFTAPRLSSIGKSAFSKCVSLQSIDISRLAAIPDSAFYNCSRLSSINPNSATSIGTNAFRGCTSLEDAIFPNATTIGEVSFKNCTSLKSIDIPRVVELTPVTFASSELSNVKYLNIRGVDQNHMDVDVFKGMTGLKCINIVKIHYGVVHSARIEWGLPDDCDVICQDGWIETSATALSDLLQGAEITPESGEVVEKTFYSTSGFKTTVTQTNIDLYDPLVKHVNAAAFRNNSQLKKVYFPKAHRIMENAFNGCQNLVHARFPTLSNADYIGNSAFSNCPRLKYIDLGSLDHSSVSAKKLVWGIPSGCVVLCMDGVVVA